MNTPRPRSPPPPHPPLFKPTTPPPPPPPPPLLSTSTSTSTSPPHDFSFSYYLSSSPPSVHHRRAVPHTTADMSRIPPFDHVSSDLSDNNYAKANQRRQTGSSSKDRDRDKAKNKAASPFFSGLGGSWRSGLSRDTAAGKADEEVKRKAKVKRGLDVGQWVKKYMASMVEHLLASFSSRHGERERREQQRRRPHSFSAHGSSALREQRERWRRRRRQLSSAPASLRASPANSGHLSVGGSVKVSTSSEESTMEELQSAIEAAIAHCKNSIAVAK